MMKIVSDIDVYGFLIGLFVGLYVASSLTGFPHVVVNYPTPENTKGVTFVDDKGACFQYEKIEVDCTV